MLTFAASTADIIGVNPALSLSTERDASFRDAVPMSIDTKLSWIREAAGDRFDDIEIHGWLKHAQVTPDSRAAAERLTTLWQAEPEDKAEKKTAAAD